MEEPACSGYTAVRDSTGTRGFIPTTSLEFI
jgi:hypothetical protein